MKGSRLADVRQLRFEQHGRDRVLTVYPADDPGGIPFPVARLFTLAGIAAGAERGHHAHRECTQLLVALAGSATLRIDDGHAERTFALDSPAAGVLVPPGLWITVAFPGPATVVGVFCDRPFAESDYIRDRAEFSALKGLGE